MSDIFDRLNDEQKKAVTRTEGPVLILAGAGSGKTRVITYRIAYLLQKCRVNPWNILAITFTNKAAGEMRRRVDELVGFGSESIWISTFHSLCVRILRRHIELLGLGYTQSFTIYDTDDQKRLMKDIMKRLQIDPKTLRERAALSAISAAKNEMIGPQAFRRGRGSSGFYQERIADCYDQYQLALRKNNAVDFDDLLLLTVRLFRDNPEVLENYQERFRYIMVDEYQDTNRVQFELVRLMSASHRNLCVVGDDDQSIYKFRGADIRNILDFEKQFPEALVVKLEQNYRSTQNVLDAANAVIRNNAQRRNKSLWTQKGKGSPIHFRHFNTPQEEAAFIVSDIVRARRQNGQFHYSDFAVLYRTNAQSRLLEEQFVRSSIPYNIVGGTNFYERREIRDILSYLKTIDNGQDELAVKRIINVPRRGIGASTIERVDAFALRENIPFIQALGRTQEIPDIGRSRAKLESFMDMIREFRSFAQNNLPEKLLRHVISAIGYEDELHREYEEDAEDRIANLQELIGKMTDYQETAEDPSLSGFLEEVALVADIDSVGEDDDKVLLMTLHSAKGLEFPYVYIAGMEDGLFPSGMSLDSDDEFAIEEERRLAYVGITRAQQNLTLTACRSRFHNGEYVYNEVSRFVSEIPEDLFDSVPSYKSSYDFRRDDDPMDDFAGRSGSRWGTGGRGASENAWGAGGRGTSGNGWSTGSRGSSGNAWSTGGRGTAENGRSAASTDTGAGRKRPKAVYVRPHTAEERKPYIAKAMNSGRKAVSSGALQKGIPASSRPDYGPGDRVQHVKFGDGTVRRVEEGPRDYKVTVDFDDAGTKVMYAAFAKLRKI